MSAEMNADGIVQTTQPSLRRLQMALQTMQVSQIDVAVDQKSCQTFGRIY